MSRYGIKEVFATLQGEGTRAGTKAVFVRFTGCNLWDGMPIHRDKGEGACAKWCDTDFFKGTVMDTETLLAKMHEAWGDGDEHDDRWVVLTGGEPCLQIDAELMAAFESEGWSVAIETNGTIANEHAEKAQWICVAPKLRASDGEPTTLLLARIDELKVVIPGAAPGDPAWTESMLADLEGAWPDAQLFLQPQDPLVSSKLVEATALKRPADLEVDADSEDELDARWQRHVKRCIQIIMGNSRWRLSLQTHKFMGMP